MYFGQPVGVLALGAVRPFTARARNTLVAIAPSLAVALANASANERLSAQSRRLAEQNELLEQQRSRIARTAQELQRASALKDRFLAAVSHELRTPMTVILGFTGTLLRGTQGELNPRQRESLERVQRNARLLLGLINDVLDISKIESGKAELSREVVSIPTLLQQVETDFEETARRKGIALTTRSAPDLPTVISDPAKLTQILANLVSNALKFTESGSIEVRAEPRGRRQWALVVTDSGIGIPEEEQEAIFEEFRQGESTSHQARGGTGLGLAIVRKLALLLGGTVGVQSKPGAGSTFTVTLPGELPGGEPEAAPRPAGAFAGPARRALVVDDDESTRQLLRLELEPYGFTVIEASDGARAVEIARRERPDVMMLDVLMPRLDGWAALKSLKEHPDTRDIPVIIHSVVDDRALGISLGAFDYLVKPVQPGRLFEVLSRAGVLGFPGYVLIVDDDPDIRQLLERELQASGFRAVAAEGGSEALARIAEERPAAVLLDLLMAEPDGFEVLCRIREDPALQQVPVVIMTAKDLTPSDYERLNGSAQRILKKGADTARLVRDALGTVVQERSISG
jgi:signal transduction histidine kinase/DNA-binding response OmpR family regulator